MRRVVVEALLAASLLLNSAIVTATPRPRFAEEPKPAAVDVELAIAVDVSHSMTLEELAVQREGYADAIRSSEFIQAVRAGPSGRIAITYFEWSGPGDQRVIIPWRLIDGPEQAGAAADEIMLIPVERGTHTSISGAIRFAMPLFDRDPYAGVRRVIDISGDGPNNSGPPVAPLRAEALAKGLVINGLPIMMNEFISSADTAHLDWYFEDCVIGGPGAFMIPITDRGLLKQAILNKLLKEISALTPERQLRTVADKAPRVNCALDEKIFDDR